MDYLNSNKRLYYIYSIKYKNVADMDSMAIIADESDEEALNRFENLIVKEGFDYMKKSILEKAIVNRTNYLCPKSGVIALQDNMLKKEYF